MKEIIKWLLCVISIPIILIIVYLIAAGITFLIEEKPEIFFIICISLAMGTYMYFDIRSW